MKLDLNAIKENVLVEGTSTVSAEHLSQDMTEIYRYFNEVPEDIPEGLASYLKENMHQFDLLDFANHYLSHMVGKPLQSKMSEDEKYVTFNLA